MIKRIWTFMDNLLRVYSCDEEYGLVLDQCKVNHQSISLAIVVKKDDCRPSIKVSNQKYRYLEVK